jgi:ABC-type bacteriocin/lantibiotic exporter with double-glycine peptidase domain
MASHAYHSTTGTGESTADLGSHPAPLRRLYQLLLPERSDLWTVFIFAAFSGVLYLATPLAVDAVVNNLAFGANEGVYVQALVILSLALFGFLCLFGLVRAAQHYVVELVQRRLFVRLTADMAYRLPRVRMEAMDRKLGPDLVNRFFDVITVQKAGALLLMDGINLVLGAFIGLIVLGFYHPFLLVFDLLLILHVLAVLFGLGRGAIDTSIDESYAKHDVAGWLEQVAIYPFVFKARGAARLACDRADEMAQHYLEARSTHFKILMRQIVGLLALQAVASATLLGVGGFLVLDAELTLGQLVAAELIVSAIVANLASLGKHAELFYDALASVDKIGYVVDLPIERDGGEKPTQQDEHGASVRINDLVFGYNPSRPVLDGVTFSVSPGERVALVGRMGYGTSTLMDILVGARDAQSGSVQIDGLDLRNWDLAELRDDVALVRGLDIIEADIFENVRMGRPDVTLHDVQNALDNVGLLEDILKLKDGLETELMFGGRPLSSSQRTRLVLARAIVAKPRLLLIDENLENLEAETLEQLTEFLFDPQHPWTLLVATHDASVVERCDARVEMGSFGPVRTGVTA